MQRVPIQKRVRRADGSVHTQTFWVNPEKSDEGYGHFIRQSQCIAPPVPSDPGRGFFRSVAEMGRAALSTLYRESRDRVAGGGGKIKGSLARLDDALVYAGLNADRVSVLQHEIGENYIIARKISRIAAAPFMVVGGLAMNALRESVKAYRRSRVGDDQCAADIEVDEENGTLSFVSAKRATDEDVSESLEEMVSGDQGGPSADSIFQAFARGELEQPFRSALESAISRHIGVSVVTGIEREPPGFSEPLTTLDAIAGASVARMECGDAPGSSMCFGEMVDEAGRRHRVSPIFTVGGEVGDPDAAARATAEFLRAMSAYRHAVGEAVGGLDGPQPRQGSGLEEGSWEPVPIYEEPWIKKGRFPLWAREADTSEIPVIPSPQSF